MLKEKGAAARTIEIQRPELEALIQERMKSGAFESVEDALLQALKSEPPASGLTGEVTTRSGAELVAAMRSSPYREVDLESASHRSPVRGVSF